MRTKKNKIEAPPSAPMRASKPKKVKAEPLAWVRGLRISENGDEVWFPLYCFAWPSQRAVARGTLRRILELDVMPRELANFEDFDLQMPAGYQPESDDEPLEASVEAQEPSRAVRQPKAKPAPLERATAPVKKKGKRCKDRLEGDPRKRCIRKGSHGSHRTLDGEEWTDD